MGISEIDDKKERRILLIGSLLLQGNTIILFLVICIIRHIPALYLMLTCILIGVVSSYFTIFLDEEIEIGLGFQLAYIPFSLAFILPVH